MYTTVKLHLSTEEDTRKLAMRFASVLQAPFLLALGGEIGMGKTTFVRALLQSIGVQGAVKSPTFSLVESYVFLDKTFHHFDLYRIQREEELDYIGWREYFTQDSILLVEWPEHAPGYLAKADMHLLLCLEKEGRLLEITAKTAIAKEMLSCLLAA